MGYENIAANDRMALVGMAQMARGSGWWFEGTRGGRGHMGLVTVDGRERVIKFDTHGGMSRAPVAGQSSNDLRVRLWTIASNDANGLSEEVRNEIRTKLELGADGTPPQFKPLLDRKVVAQVLTLIGGKELWDAARTGFNEEVQATDLDDPSTFESSFRACRMGVTIGGDKYGVKKSAREEELEKFFKVADDFGNANDRYVKLGGNLDKLDLEDSLPSGKNLNLVDAGHRYVLRDLSDKEDNDRVHRVFARAILAHFDGRIPKCVQELMTDFTGGHPLSAKRIGLIRDAIRIADARGGDLPSHLSPRKLPGALKTRGMTFEDAKDAAKPVAGRLIEEPDGDESFVVDGNGEFEFNPKLANGAKKATGEGADKAGSVALMESRLGQKGPTLTAETWTNVAKRLTTLAGGVDDENVADRLGRLAGRIRDLGVTLGALRNETVTDLRAQAGERKRSLLTGLVDDLAQITAELPEFLVGGSDEGGDAVWEEAMALHAELSWFAAEVGNRRKGVPDDFGQMKIADFLGREPDSAAVKSVVRQLQEMESLFTELANAEVTTPNEWQKAIKNLQERADALLTTLKDNRQQLSPRMRMLLEEQTAMSLKLLGSLSSAVAADAEAGTQYVNELVMRAGGFGRLVREVVNGRVDADAYRKLRGLGYEDWAIVPDFSPSTTVSEKDLGEGAYNTASDTTGGGIVGERRRWVLKNGSEANRGLARMPYAKISGCGANAVANNLANGLAQDLLGVDVVVETKLSASEMALDNTPDILMGFAEGESLGKAAQKAKNGLSPLSESQQMRHGALQEFGALDWFDWFTGQGDRHFGNGNITMEEKDRKAFVSVKAFDNDASFPAYRTGLAKFTYGETGLKKIVNEVKKIERAKQRVGSLDLGVDLVKFLSVNEIKDGSAKRYEISLGFDKDGIRWPAQVAECLTEVFGINNARRPSYIPEALLQRLEDLEPVVTAWKDSGRFSEGTDDRKLLLPLARMQKTISAAQFGATMSRLEEMIAYAKELKGRGLVLKNHMDEDNLAKIQGEMLENAWSAYRVCDGWDWDEYDRVRCYMVDSAAEFLSRSQLDDGFGIMAKCTEILSRELCENPVLPRLAASQEGRNLISRVIEASSYAPQKKSWIMQKLLLLVGDLDPKMEQNPDRDLVAAVAKVLDESDDDLVNELAAAFENRRDEQEVMALMDKWETVYNDAVEKAGGGTGES